MRINEVIKQVDLSKRAVKFYEEKGLLTISRDSNGYRNYTDEDIRILKEISVYRKLGIGITDIKKLLDGKNEALLQRIYEEKKETLHAEQEELLALKQFIGTHDVNAIFSSVDYQTVGQAINDMVPGFYGYYFMQHFQPYLQIKLTTPEQRKAYETIIDFWDNVNLRPPLLIRLTGFLMLHLIPQPSLDQMISQMDETIRMYLNPTEEEYESLKKKTLQGVKIKNNPLVKYHPIQISQRRFMKCLQDCGYNDIFIPAMIALSPKYRTYHEALTQMNEKICGELGLYYDSDYNLVMKKGN